MAALESASLSQISRQVLDKNKAYCVVGTLQQAQAFCIQLGLEYSLHLYPQNIYEIAARLDDPYQMDNRVRIILISEDSIGLAKDILPAGLTLVVVECPYNSEGGYSVSKILDPKSKQVSKLAKILTPIDLRRVNLCHNCPAHVTKYYQYFPFTAERVSSLSAEEVESIWEWTNHNSVVVSYFESLLDGDIKRWGEIVSGDLFRILYAYKTAENPDKRTPVIIQTSDLFIRPFLEYAITQSSDSYGRVMQMFASWVVLSSTKWQGHLTPGLTRRVSRRNYEYITLQPSAVAIKKWVELVQAVLI